MKTTGLVKDAVTALHERTRREIDEGLLPSCQFALARDGEVVEHVTLGVAVVADPDTGLSFAYLTNGLDRNLPRYARRGSGLCSKAAVCAA